jgi:hypothetical protein
MCSQLQLENERLKRELHGRQNFQSLGGLGGSAPSTFRSDNPQQFTPTNHNKPQHTAVQLFTKDQSSSKQQASGNRRSVSTDKYKKIGTTLMMMCFAFGMWLRAQNQHVEGSSSMFPREPIPEVTLNPAHVGRALMEVGNNNNNINNSPSLLQLPSSTQSSLDDAPVEPIVRRNVCPAEFVNSSVPHAAMAQLPDSPLNQYIEQNRSLFHPNTAIMTCNDLRQIVPLNAQPISPDEPLYMSLLIPQPPTTDLTDLSATTKDGNQSFIEITCQVVNVKSVTLSPQLVDNYS